MQSILGDAVFQSRYINHATHHFHLSDWYSVVEDILLKAGWTQLDWKGGDLVFKRASKKDVGIVTMVGMFVQMDPSKVTEFTQPAYTLQEAFKAEGIAARAEPGSASTAENKEAMHILIGKKP